MGLLTGRPTLGYRNCAFKYIILYEVACPLKICMFGCKICAFSCQKYFRFSRLEMALLAFDLATRNANGQGSLSCYHISYRYFRNHRPTQPTNSSSTLKITLLPKAHQLTKLVGLVGRVAQRVA